jgi:flavin reductase (DIM6/NTAB) family NADH-FMN oxidoreductase RutF
MRDAFEGIAARLEYPMYIVTAADGAERDGCLIGFATQCSIEPARFLACISDKNRTLRVARTTDVLVVHLVEEGADDLVELFGGETGDDVDKFSRCEWTSGPAGVPVLAGCPSWFAGRVLDRRPLGDHVGHLLEPFAGALGPRTPQFPASRARRVDPGHEA